MCDFLSQSGFNSTRFLKSVPHKSGQLLQQRDNSVTHNFIKNVARQRNWQFNKTNIDFYRVILLEFLQNGMIKDLRSPVLSILDEVLTVSPNRQYLGIVVPTTPATTGPVKEIIRTRSTGMGHVTEQEKWIEQPSNKESRSCTHLSACGLVFNTDKTHWRTRAQRFIEEVNWIV